MNTTSNGYLKPVQQSVLQILKDNGGWMTIADLYKVRGAPVQIRTLKALLNHKLIEKSNEDTPDRFIWAYRAVKHG